MQEIVKTWGKNVDSCSDLAMIIGTAVRMSPDVSTAEFLSVQLEPNRDDGQETGEIVRGG